MKNYYICKEVLERHKSDIPTDTYNRIIDDLNIAFNDTLRKENISLSSTIADLQDDIELFKLIIYRLLDD
jgi:glutathionyl-hydroquinone reductase